MLREGLQMLLWNEQRLKNSQAPAGITTVLYGKERECEYVMQEKCWLCSLFQYSMWCQEIYLNQKALLSCQWWAASRAVYTYSQNKMFTISARLQSRKASKVVLPKRRGNLVNAFFSSSSFHSSPLNTPQVWKVFPKGTFEQPISF